MSFRNRVYDLLTVAAVFFIIVTVVMVIVGCTPLSTKPFDPTQQVSQEELEYQQVKSLLPEGMEELRSGMDCVAYVEYQIAWCEATLSCTSLQYGHYKRDLRRLKRMSGQCLYSPEHIRELYKEMRRGTGTHRGMGR